MLFWEYITKALGNNFLESLRSPHISNTSNPHFTNLWTSIISNSALRTNDYRLFQLSQNVRLLIFKHAPFSPIIKFCYSLVRFSLESWKRILRVLVKNELIRMWDEGTRWIRVNFNTVTDLKGLPTRLRYVSALWNRKTTTKNNRFL